MSKALHVIKREYSEHVRKRSFIVGTILVPVFMLMFAVVPVLLTVFVPDDQYQMVILDERGDVAGEFADALSDTLDDGSAKFLISGETARDNYTQRRRELADQVLAGELDMIVAVPASAIDDGNVDYITRDVRSFKILERFENVLEEIILKRRLAREGLDYERVSSLTAGVRLEMSQVTNTGDIEGKDSLAEWGVVFVFVMILYMALLTWGITVSRGIIEEKGSRIVEVLLSSVRPVDLLMGKVVGIGLAGLTQLAIWSVVGLSLSLYGATAAMALKGGISISADVFVWMIVYFLLGFLFYSAIFTVIGSICSNEQDAQQLQGLVTMPLIVPILLLMLIIQSPNSTFTAVMSLIPLFTPMIMLARIILVEPPLWQVLLSLGLMLASIYAAISFSARVFRVGILMYGKRPNMREMIRWYRQAG